MGLATGLGAATADAVYGAVAAFGLTSLSRLIVSQRYWLQPEVWSDIRAAYEEFFRREPNAVSWRHNYAWYAYKCQAWDDLNAQLKLLGPVNYDYFGGRTAFDKMVAEAREHAKP